MSKNNPDFPKARRKKLEIRELPNETLIYDQETKLIHYLDESMTQVWNRCDGKTAITTIEQNLNNSNDNKVSSVINFLTQNKLII